MLEYLLKSGACLAIFLMFYKLFLERESIHVFKRYYLLAALLLSLAIPAIVFVEYVEVAPVSEVFTVPTQAVQAVAMDQVEPANDMDMLNLPLLLWTIYGLGVFLFGFKFVKNLRRIVLRIRRNPKYKINSITNVLLSDLIAPHTFFRYIFLNREKYEKREIPYAVLLHEETHARQKHSLDVLFVELLQVLFWFNPLIYLAKRSIKLNHEFLADQAVVNNGVETATYQNILLAFSSNALAPQFSNSINYSSIKKRFTVMKKRTSKKSILIRSFLLLPLLAILLYGFSETKIIQKESALIEEVIPSEAVEDPFIESLEQKGATEEQLAKYNTLVKKYNKRPKESRVVLMEDLKVLEDIYSKMTTRQKEVALSFPEYAQNDKPQDGASRKLMAEYNKLAKHYNDMPRNKMKILKKDVDRLAYIYGLMSDKQKADAEPFPDFPEPPPPPKAPKAPKTLNEREEAAAIIEKIIEEQDPYDVVGGNMRLTHTSKQELQEQRALKEMLTQVEEAKLIERRKKMTKQVITIGEGEIKLEKQEKLIQVEEEKLIEQEGKMVEHEAKIQKIEEKLQVPTPPLPPEPISPLDHVIEMAKKDAVFYYEGKEISSDKAIELLKNNDALNIDSRGSNSKRPVVRISKEPIVIEN